jgi:hypothetical protein
MINVLRLPMYRPGRAAGGIVCVSENPQAQIAGIGLALLGEPPRTLILLPEHRIQRSGDQKIRHKELTRIQAITGSAGFSTGR